MRGGGPVDPRPLLRGVGRRHRWPVTANRTVPADASSAAQCANPDAGRTGPERTWTAPKPQPRPEPAAKGPAGRRSPRCDGVGPTTVPAGGPQGIREKPRPGAQSRQDAGRPPPARPRIATWSFAGDPGPARCDKRDAAPGRSSTPGQVDQANPPGSGAPGPRNAGPAPKPGSGARLAGPGPVSPTAPRGHDPQRRGELPGSAEWLDSSATAGCQTGPYPTGVLAAALRPARAGETTPASAGY